MDILPIVLIAVGALLLYSAIVDINPLQAVQLTLQGKSASQAQPASSILKRNSAMPIPTAPSNPNPPMWA